jgi:tRNA-2-methylthio-N6-dimethylallyladenosine synthase
MRGCDHKCSYCIVPHTRGRQVDRSQAEILDEVRRLAADGAREVTLLGQNINTYGRYLEERPTLGDLIRRVHEIEGIGRIRFITSNPMDLEADLLRAMAEIPEACGYLHFPAQSGSDSVLRRMYRGYTREKYLRLCRLARELHPGIELASDLIVGFPGETENEYLDTRRLVEEVEFKQIYVFKYSPRPGTRAAELPDDVSEEQKRFRKNDLLALHESISARRNARFVGREIEVLVDGPSRNAERLASHGEGNHVVHFEGPSTLAGRFVRVRIHTTTAPALYGDLVPGSER